MSLGRGEQMERPIVGAVCPGQLIMWAGACRLSPVHTLQVIYLQLTCSNGLRWLATNFHQIFKWFSSLILNSHKLLCDATGVML